MDSLLLDVLKNVPFTLAVLVIFYLLMNNVLNNAKQQSTSSDGITNRLIDSYSKLTTVVEAMNTNITSLERTINERNVLIQQQNEMLDRLDEKVSTLLGKENAKI